MSDSMMLIGLVVIVAAVAAIVGMYIGGRRNGNGQQPAAAPPAAQLPTPVPLNDAQRDATHLGAVRGAGFVPNWRQVGKREGVLVEPLASGGVLVETFEAEGDGRERFVSPGLSEGGNALAIAVSGAEPDEAAPAKPPAPKKAEPAEAKAEVPVKPEPEPKPTPAPTPTADKAKEKPTQGGDKK